MLKKIDKVDPRGADLDYPTGAPEDSPYPPDEPSDAEYQRWCAERKAALTGGDEFLGPCMTVSCIKCKIPILGIPVGFDIMDGIFCCECSRTEQFNMTSTKGGNKMRFPVVFFEELYRCFIRGGARVVTVCDTAWGPDGAEDEMEMPLEQCLLREVHYESGCWSQRHIVGYWVAYGCCSGSEDGRERFDSLDDAIMFGGFEAKHKTSRWGVSLLENANTSLVRDSISRELEQSSVKLEDLKQKAQYIYGHTAALTLLSRVTESVQTAVSKTREAIIWRLLGYLGYRSYRREAELVDLYVKEVGLTLLRFFPHIASPISLEDLEQVAARVKEALVSLEEIDALEKRIQLLLEAEKMERTNGKTEDLTVAPFTPVNTSNGLTIFPGSRRYRSMHKIREVVSGLGTKIKSAVMRGNFRIHSQCCCKNGGR